MQAAHSLSGSLHPCYGKSMIPCGHLKIHKPNSLPQSRQGWTRLYMHAG